MDKYKLFDLLAADADTTDANAHTEMLREVLEDYPYFQTAHLLLSNKLTTTGNINNTILARAATHIANRETLYRLLLKNNTANNNANVAITAITTDSDTKNDEVISNNRSIFDELSDNDKPTEAISKADLHTIFDDLPSEQETEAIPQNLHNLFDDLPNHEQDTEVISLDRNLLDINNNDNEATLLIQKSQIQLQDAANINDEIINIASHNPINEANTNEIHTNTEEIEAQAREQVEKELQQFLADKKLIPTTESSSNLTDLSHLLERESRELIRSDVEKDLQNLSLDPEFDSNQQADMAESTHLIQSLREKVETYKKEKNNDNDNTPTIPTTDSDIIKNIVSKQPNSYINHDDDDSDVVYLGNHIEEQANRSLSDNTDSILSETMARVYARQGYTQKAIQIYEQLMAKYPEKSSYFAEKIAKLQ